MDIQICAADVLEQAADNMIIYGWTQGTYGLAGEEQCLIGHVVTVCKENWELNDYVYWVLEERLNKSPQGWNDQIGRTFDEVRDLMLLTAKDLRNEAVS